MRRTIEQAFEALEAQVTAWSNGNAKPDVRLLVYPPEWEPKVLLRLQEFARRSQDGGHPVELEDVGVGMKAELESRQDLVARLEKMPQEQQLSDLEHIASGYLRRMMRTPIEEGTVCRIVMNTGSIATFVSYSAIANELVGNGTETGVPPTVIALPGEGDDRSLNIMQLRVDTNYRVPRI